MPTLKTVAVVLGLALAQSTALAADSSTAIFKAPVGAADASKSKTFAINRDLGRAWVEIDLYYNTSETTDTRRVVVPGLSFDPAASAVVFKAQGKTVECAKVEERGWIFKHTRIEPTGNCELTHKYVEVPVDNGFTIEQVEHFEVHFNPALATANATPLKN